MTPNAQYNNISIRRDFGSNNGIVNHMLRATRDANIDDGLVAHSSGCRCKTSLVSWTTSAKNDFEAKNNHGLVTHTVGKLSTALERQSSRLDVMEK